MPDDPSEYVRALAALNLFETASFSETDVQRAEMYRQEAQRETARRGIATVDEYLASLEMKLVLERFDRFNLPRIAQLIQRSNQFNLATRRYSEAQCEALMNDPTKVPFYISLRDRFGDYGLISVVILDVQDDRVVVDEYLMSCRVLQRGVEHYAMTEIVRIARERGSRHVEGTFRPTAKNAMVREFYSQFGFHKTHESPEGDVTWVLDVENYAPRPTFLARVLPQGAPLSGAAAQAQ
jgi:FkbH-like protein